MTKEWRIQDILRRAVDISRLAPLAAALLLLLGGCGFRGMDVPSGRPTGPAAEEPAIVAPPARGPARALHAEARRLLARGDGQRAEMTLERALRIEPGNAEYWHTMAQIKFSQGDYGQTIQLCRKSKSLAGRDASLIRRNDQLIARARQAQG